MEERVAPLGRLQSNGLAVALGGQRAIAGGSQGFVHRGRWRNGQRFMDQVSQLPQPDPALCPKKHQLTTVGAEPAKCPGKGRAERLASSRVPDLHPIVFGVGSHVSSVRAERDSSDGERVREHRRRRVEVAQVPDCNGALVEDCGQPIAQGTEPGFRRGSSRAKGSL